MSEPIIKVRNLVKVYNGVVQAVKGISFDVYKGEIFGLLGPNGAGKSTTIKMLTTVLRPTSGTAEVCGYDVAKNPVDVRRCISVVPQEYTSDEDLTGFENIMLMASLYGIPKAEAEKRAWELLEMVNLKEAANRKVETYSGGMRRRLEIAMSLINRPKVLFLDEPTLGLDVQTRAAIWEYIKKLKEEYDITILLTTHYMEEADSLCNRIAIIDHGKIIKIGSPEELKASLGGDVIEINISEKEDISNILLQIPSVKEVKKIDTSTYRIKVESGEKVAPYIIETILSKGFHAIKLSMEKPTLDQVYLELTGKSLRDEESGGEDIWRTRITLRRARR